MQFAAPHQALSNVGRLQRRAFGGRMRCKIAGSGYQDVPTLVCVAPYGELPNGRLQHLIGMKARVFAQNRTRERGDQCLRRMAKHLMACRKSGREIDLTLPVKRV